MAEYIDRTKSVCNNCIDTKCVWRTTGWGIDPPVMGCPNFKAKPVKCSEARRREENKNDI